MLWLEFGTLGGARHQRGGFNKLERQDRLWRPGITRVVRGSVGANALSPPRAHYDIIPPHIHLEM